MQIFNNNKNVSLIYARALSLAMNSETILPNSNVKEISEKKSYNTKVMDAFFNKVTKKINEEFSNNSHLYHNALLIEDVTPAIMDILSVRAASIKRIATLVNTLPWLGNDLIAFVNKPQYRKNSEIRVKTPNLALSYIGLDNLKLVMPTFFLKHWLPTNSASFPLIKRNLWKNSLSTALATQKLAKKYGLDEFTAFSAGLLSNLGLLAVSQGFLNVYNELYERELNIAYRRNNKKLHTALTTLDMSPQLLLEHITQHSSSISADIVKLMGFKYLRVTETITELSSASHINELSPLAKIVVQAKAFIAFRNLAKEKLITTEEAKTLLSAAKLTNSDIALLKKSNIDHIKLNFS